MFYNRTPSPSLQVRAASSERRKLLVDCAKSHALQLGSWRCCCHGGLVRAHLGQRMPGKGVGKGRDGHGSQKGALQTLLVKENLNLSLLGLFCLTRSPIGVDTILGLSTLGVDPFLKDGVDSAGQPRKNLDKKARRKRARLLARGAQGTAIKEYIMLYI